MPREIDEDVNPQSSSGTETQDVADDGIQDMPPSDADSSPAEDVAEDTQSIIQDVVGAEDAAAGSSPEGEEDQAAEEGGEVSDEDAEYENLPFGKHPRFQEVLGKVKAAEAKAEEFEADAGRYRNVEKFLSDYGLTADEAAGAMQIQALAKTNPVEAWNQIKPWVQQLATAAGAIVPPDLQQRVKSGELTIETAREIASAQARATAADTQRTADLERQQRQQAENARNSIIESVTGWETERKMRDPNFGAKYDALQREVAFLQTREGRPNDVQGVRDQLDRAYDAVNASFKPTAEPQQTTTRKKAIRPVTGGQSAGKAHAAPETTMGIIDTVMAQG